MRWLNRSIQCFFSLLDGAELSSAELVLHMHQVLDFWLVFFDPPYRDLERDQHHAAKEGHVPLCVALGLSGEILACAIEKSHGVYGGVVEEWMRLLFVKSEVRE